MTKVEERIVSRSCAHESFRRPLYVYLTSNPYNPLFVAFDSRDTCCGLSLPLILPSETIARQVSGQPPQPTLLERKENVQYCAGTISILYTCSTHLASPFCRSRIPLQYTCARAETHPKVFVSDKLLQTPTPGARCPWRMSNA